MTSASTLASRNLPHSLPFLQNGGACGALLRGMDWSRHPLGPPGQWPVMLQTTVGIVLGSRQPMLICWGSDSHAIYNDGYAMLCGQRHPAALGQAIAAIWYDNWSDIGPIFARASAGESIHMDDLALVMHRNGYAEEAHFSFSYTPMRNDRNEVVGVLTVCAETTEQVRLRRELEHERAHLGQLFEQAPSFIVKLDGPQHTFEMANPAYLQLIGHRDVIGRPAALALPEVVGQGFIELLDAVYTTGVTSRIDAAKVALQRVPGDPLDVRFVDFVYGPITDADGTTTGVSAIGIDVTDRTNALSKLKASEQFLRSVIAASPDCIKVLGLDGNISFISDGGRQIMEVGQDQVVEGIYWPEFWQEPIRTEVMTALAQARQGKAARFQGYGDTMAGNRRYWDVRVTPMLDADDQPHRILVVSRDISYLRRIEEEREHLTNELSHRLKNVFAMVQSVLNQTLRQAVSLQDGREILSGRVQALARAQDILTRSIVSEMQINEVVESALLPHRTGEGRFAINGPDAVISGRQGLGLSLALHELATNATKYGALSGSEGSVAIGWDIKPDGHFTFCWQETDGPQVISPARNGFGSVLIEKIVATYFEGSATLDFHPTGVVFRLTGTIAPPGAADATDPY